MASEANAWDFFANYELFELIKKAYVERHNQTPNTTRSRQIAAPFVHARGFYRAAGVSDLTIKPLLLYYGALALTRGLVLMLTKGLAEATLAQSHGLTTKNWQASLSSENPDLADLRLVV